MIDTVSRLLLSKEQNDEGSVARDDDSSTSAGNIIIYLIFYPGNAETDWVDFCGLTGYICQPPKAGQR